MFQYVIVMYERFIIAPDAVRGLVRSCYAPLQQVALDPLQNNWGRCGTPIEDVFAREEMSTGKAGLMLFFFL